jgi:predicted dehydrogenase
VADRTPRVGVIGVGTIGRLHLKSWQAAGAQIAAVADVQADAARSAATEFDCASFSDPLRLLTSGAVDVVTICSPPATHEELAVAALKAGVGVLCEKPLAHNAAAAQRIDAAVKATGGLLAVGFCHRFSTEVGALKDLIDRGELGTVMTMHNRFASHLLRAEHTWFSDPDVAGGGAMADTSIHSIDLFRFLVGEPVGVSAITSTRTCDLGPALRVEDTSALLLKAKDGTIGVIEASWRTPVGGSRIDVFGTKGSATLDYESMTLTVGANGESERRLIEVPAGDRFVRQAENILDCWRSGSAPQVGSADGLMANLILEAAYRSADHLTSPGASGD